MLSLPEQQRIVRAADEWRNGGPHDEHIGNLFAAVEAIVAARVRAALQEANDTAEGYISLESSGHLNERGGIGCQCGFCVWSSEHVAVMSFRDGFRRYRASVARAATP